MAGAQQGLKGSGFQGRGGYPSKLWDQLQAGVQCRLVVGILVVVGQLAWPRGRYCTVVWLAWLRDGYLAVGLEQSCDLVQTQGQRAWQNGAAALQTYGAGIWQAGCSYIRSWCGEAIHDLSLYSVVFLAVPGALPQSGMSPASLQDLWVSS
jgi:hypothetical protein